VTYDTHTETITVTISISDGKLTATADKSGMRVTFTNTYTPPETPPDTPENPPETPQTPETPETPESPEGEVLGVRRSTEPVVSSATAQVLGSRRAQTGDKDMTMNYVILIMALILLTAMVVLQKREEHKA